ncbi:CD36-like protein 1 [Dinothrombium tinctorium]|uniref:CD36-like protein 1 n=1 Tax=Dinothrombium tinctorium TaxID=1965070 RepID=A0A3S3RW75_9ACAR|nr:CD36-like protein 1 [Dinothrombium tinctorium]
MFQKATPKLKILFFISILLILLGVALYLKFNDLLAFRLRREILLTESSPLYAKWEKTPVPLAFDVYLFEIKNPQQVLDGGTAVVRERGPFRFTEFRRKRVIGYSEDGRIIKYEEYKIYYFDRSKSSESLNRRITVVNVPAVTIASRITNFLSRLPFQPITRPIVSGVVSALMELHRQNLFVNRRVSEILFEGYRVNFLDTVEIIAQPLKLIGIKLPPIPLRDNTFGLFYGRNNTREGPFEVHTGVYDHSNIAQFVSWNDKRNLDKWYGDPCNKLTGTDGTQFSPLLSKDAKLRVFAFESCRSYELGFDSETEVKGIKTYRFKLLHSNFRNVKQNSENWCYCEPRKNCSYDGVVNVSPCWFKAPIYISYPHLYNVSKAIRSRVKGLKPEPEKHISYVDIEPGSELSDELRDEMNSKLFLRKSIAEYAIKGLKASKFTSRRESNDVLQKNRLINELKRKQQLSEVEQKENAISIISNNNLYPNLNAPDEEKQYDAQYVLQSTDENFIENNANDKNSNNDSNNSKALHSLSDALDLNGKIVPPIEITQEKAIDTRRYSLNF